MAQGRQKEAAEFLQAQQQALEGSASAGKVGAVELQLLLGKVTPGPTYLSMLLTSQQGIDLKCEPVWELFGLHTRGIKLSRAEFWMNLVLWLLHAAAASSAQCGGPCQGSAIHSAGFRHETLWLPCDARADQSGRH